MRQDWTYIAQYHNFPEQATYAHCDTRDFHLTWNDGSSVGDDELDKNLKLQIKTCREQLKNLYLYSITGSEILSMLAGLEEASGGPRNWRLLQLKTGYVGWLKYIRFCKVDDVYIIYTIAASKPRLIRKEWLVPSNVLPEEES